MKNFTAKQKEIIARKLGYDGPMQGFDEFVQSSPALAMKYEMINDKYTERMNKGGAVMRYQDGGAVMPGMVDNTSNDIAGLYQQYLGRAPDAEGLKFYSDYLSGGGNFETVKNNIMSSPEARSLLRVRRQLLPLTVNKKRLLHNLP